MPVAALVLASIATVILLRLDANGDSRAALRVMELASVLDRARALERQATGASPEDADRSRDELARSLQSTQVSLSQLVEVIGESPVLPLVREYLAAAELQLELLSEGQLDRAIALGSARLDPLYAEVEAGLDTIAVERERSAWDANLRASITAIAAIIVVTLSVAGLVLKLQRTREASRAAARERDRLRELDLVKDRLIATVSHELRTPLASIIGYTELLLEEDAAGPLLPAQRRFLTTIERNGHRLLRLGEDLLLLSRVDAGQLGLRREAVDLAALVEDVAGAQAMLAARGGVDLTTDLESATVEGDPARLTQIVENLVSNAVKFTLSGGRVHVIVRPEGRAALLTVADTGIGIAEDEHPQLFDRFYRTREANERAIQGSGLGLSIVKAIVDAHDGQITVASEPGAGTTFALRLPLDETTSLSARPQEEPLAGHR